jgi:hypothetical protein
VEPFAKALEVVARVMRDGAAMHPDNDWVRRSPEYHLGRAEEHLRLWRDGDQLQDHVSHAATRSLMTHRVKQPRDGRLQQRATYQQAPIRSRP